jgi:hypothetical protein
LLRKHCFLPMFRHVSKSGQTRGNISERHSETSNVSELSQLSPGQTRKHCCGNICDSRCFFKCFPVCPPVETLLRKQNLLPEKQKCFLANSETFDVPLCFSLMFPSVCPLWETWRITGRKQCFRNNVS